MNVRLQLAIFLAAQTRTSAALCCQLLDTGGLGTLRTPAQGRRQGCEWSSRQRAAACASAWALLGAQHDSLIAAVLAAHPALTSSCRLGKCVNVSTIPRAGHVLICRQQIDSNAGACYVDARCLRPCERTLALLTAAPRLRRLRVCNATQSDSGGSGGRSRGGGRGRGGGGRGRGGRGRCRSRVDGDAGSSNVGARDAAPIVTAIALLTQLTALEMDCTHSASSFDALARLSSLQRLVQLVVLVPDEDDAGLASHRPSKASTALPIVRRLVLAMPTLQHLSMVKSSGVARQPFLFAARPIVLPAGSSRGRGGLLSLDMIGLLQTCKSTAALPCLLATAAGLTSLRLSDGASERLRSEVRALNVLSQLQQLDITWNDSTPARITLSGLRAVTSLTLRQDSNSSGFGRRAWSADQSGKAPPQLPTQLPSMTQLKSLELEIDVDLRALAAALIALTRLECVSLEQTGYDEGWDSWGAPVLRSCGALHSLTCLRIRSYRDESVGSIATHLAREATPLTALVRLQHIELGGQAAICCVHAMPTLLPHLSQLTALELRVYGWQQAWCERLESACEALRCLTRLVCMRLSSWPCSSGSSASEGQLVRCDDALVAAIAALRQLTHLTLGKKKSRRGLTCAPERILPKLARHLWKLPNLQWLWIYDLPVTYAEALSVVKRLQRLPRLRSVLLRRLCLDEMVVEAHDQGRALSIALAQMSDRLVLQASGNEPKDCALVTLQGGDVGLDLHRIEIDCDVRDARYKPRRRRQARW